MDEKISMIWLLRDMRDKITALKYAFGAPGDWGYETREGHALFNIYKLHAHINDVIAALDPDDTGPAGGADE